jgi:ferredoxin
MIAVNAKTGMTSVEGVFAGGHLVKRDLSILKAVQQAKAMAACVSQLLDAREITGLVEQYNHTMGRLQPGDLKVFASHALAIPRVEAADGAGPGYVEAEALAESGRCLHCDCRANHDCKLRRYSDEYGASQGGFKGGERASFVQVNRETGVVYEPGKCVKCGLCVRITKKEGERFGFTFVGRGFEVRAGVSLGKSLEEGLEKTAGKVISACPTGALSDFGE